MQFILWGFVLKIAAWWIMKFHWNEWEILKNDARFLNTTQTASGRKFLMCVSSIMKPYEKNVLFKLF